MNWQEERLIHKKPTGFKLEKDDVFGKFDVNHKRIDNGRLVANGYAEIDPKYFPQEKYDLLVSKLPHICPIWKDKIPWKSLTVVCSNDEVNEVLYWLSYVHGGEVSRMKKLPNGKVAIRSDYQCW